MKTRNEIAGAEVRPPDDPLVAALLAEAEGHEALARAARLRATAAAAKHQAADELLDAVQTRAEFGIGRDGLKRAAERGDLAVSKGSRGKPMVTRSEMRRYMASRPYGLRKVVSPADTDDDDDFDALDAELQRGSLVRGAK
jgi:hypothetical protein